MIHPTLRRHLIATALIIVAVVSLLSLLDKGLKIDPTKIPSELVGKPAYGFNARFIQGQDLVKTADPAYFQLADFKGKPVVLNFFASWCVSCRDEARELEAFWKKHGKDITVLGVAIQDTDEAAKRFAQAFGKTYVLGLDEQGTIAIDYGVTGVPETFIIDKQGKVIHKEVGPVTVKMLEEFLPRLDIRS